MNDSGPVGSYRASLNSRFKFDIEPVLVPSKRGRVVLLRQDGTIFSTSPHSTTHILRRPTSFAVQHLSEHETHSWLLALEPMGGLQATRTNRNMKVASPSLYTYFCWD
jgi:hypothetical protein